jgi:uncharacterized protein YndB with AHSA1/START domain
MRGTRGPTTLAIYFHALKRRIPMHEPIHQSVSLDVPPERVYSALTQSDVFSRMSGGAPAVIGTEAGMSFSCFGGMIEGRQIELVPNVRVVQAWRVRNWPAGVYSIAKFELTPRGNGTQLEFDHVGFPHEDREHLESGWHSNYWEPMKKL